MQDFRRTYSDLEIANNLFFLCICDRRHLGVKAEGTTRSNATNPSLILGNPTTACARQETRSMFSLGQWHTCTHTAQRRSPNAFSRCVCVCVEIAFKEEIRTEVKKTGLVGDEAQCSKGFFFLFFFFFFKIVTCTNASIRKNV